MTETHEFVEVPGSWRCGVCGRAAETRVHRPDPTSCEVCGWTPDATDPTTFGMVLSDHYVSEHWTEEDERRHEATRSVGNWYGSDEEDGS